MELEIFKHSSGCDKSFVEQYLSHLNERALEPNAPYAEDHHRLPRCLGGSDASSNIVRLSYRDHLKAHFLLWKAYEPLLGKSWRAALIGQSFTMMVNVPRPGDPYWKALHELTEEMLAAFESAKVASMEVIKATGRMTVERKLGIHAQTAEELSALGRMTVERGTGIHAQTAEELSALGRINGRMTVERGTGIHAQTAEERLALGRMTVERGTGIHAQTAEERSAVSRIGGKYRASLQAWKSVVNTEPTPGKAEILVWWKRTNENFAASAFAQSATLTKQSTSLWKRSKKSKAGCAARKAAAVQAATDLGLLKQAKAD